MPDDFFKPPIFIEENGTPLDVDLGATPYFHNDGGQPAYAAAVPNGVTLLPTAPVDEGRAFGREYRVPKVAGVKPQPGYGTEIQLDFDGEAIVYEPMWATRETARAFGITLVGPGEAVRLECPHPELQQIEYDYGVFAGHYSPYQETETALIPLVITDLEHHEFPHIFASTDPTLPLVISVGRYWPEKGVIRLADLWVRQGDALYIPPMPPEPVNGCVDLHNNRNSARAAWGSLGQASVVTHTLLQTRDTFTYWFWNGRPTVHSEPVA